MPTQLPRTNVTHTARVRHALEVARLRWPAEDPDAGQRHTDQRDAAAGRQRDAAGRGGAAAGAGAESVLGGSRGWMPQCPGDEPGRSGASDATTIERVATGDLPGTVLDDRYEIRSVVGSGGMAVVFRAWDTELHREVAVKVLRSDPDEPGDAQRRRREARALASINHPALVTLFDAIIRDDRSYLVMELVDGDTLRDRIHGGSLTPPDVALIAADLADGLHAVHERGIIHRDIKPANILLAPAPHSERPFRVKLSDFGIAHFSGATRATAPGLLLGTALYISPEQAGGRPLAPSSDVYALGLPLLEALTGTPAFTGTPLEVVAARLSGRGCSRRRISDGSARIPLMSELLFTPPCGPIRGWRDGDVMRATGIRYAVADRFQPPRPQPDHDEPFAAVEWAPSCPQQPSDTLAEALGPGVVNGLPHDEHCQRLSITMPADLRHDEALPVMVWIHGGSYTSGSGDLPTTDPAPLVAEQRVIVVAVTYRLGLFGFLGDRAARPANLGLLDQLEALRWVQRNIRAFGGDPDEVTAFGQSAGGDAIAHLMLAPGARSLFRRAIIQSAPFGITRGRERMNAAMAQASAHIGADTPAEQIVAAETEAERAARPFGILRAMPFGTQYGHAPLPDEADVENEWARVAPRFDVLVGRTTQEARLFLHRSARLERLDDRPLGRLLVEPVVRAATWLIYSRGARKFARRHAASGGRAWQYVIGWRAPGNAYGSAHAIDLPLLFGRPETWAPAGFLRGADPRDLERAARNVRRIWGDFAHGRTWRTARVRGVITLRRVEAALSAARA